jgi:hypothetical protein
MPGNIQSVIKLLKTNELCDGSLQCGGKIKLNQVVLSIQDFIFNNYDYMMLFSSNEYVILRD